MSKKNPREFQRRQGRDFATYVLPGRMNADAIKSTKRPYVAPKEIEGSQAAGDRGLTS